MDLTIGELVLWAISIWFISQVLLGLYDAWHVVSVKERVEELNRISNLIHQVTVEKNGEVEYWFDEDNHEFLGQGKNIDEVIGNLKARFPNHIFLLKGIGGVAKQTDWKFLDMEDFKNVQLNIKDF
jgi:hypothetical protein